MKKGILIILGLFMMVSSVEATNGSDFTNRNRIDYYTYNNAVNFFERGIEFFVFPNGDFDFDTRFNNRSLRVRIDFRGRIRNVGNVSINYDRRGNVARIGSIFMRYHRGRLVRVGDLRIQYNRWNNPVFFGNVRNFYVHNGIRFDINFGDVCDFNDGFFYRNDFRRNYTQFREDRNFYYYKARPNATIGSRSTIIRRRKANTNSNDRTIANNTRINRYRNSNTTTSVTGRRNSTTTRGANISRNTNKNRTEATPRNDKRDRRGISNRNKKEEKRSTSTRRTKKNERSTSRTRRNE